MCYSKNVGNGSIQMNDKSTKQTKAEEQAVKLWLLLSKASRSVEARAHASIEGLDMCLSDFAVLESILHKGPMPVNTIGKKILLTSGSITSAVDRLESRGLVFRSDDPNDRRVRLVDLTAEGRRLITRAFDRHALDMHDALDHLDKSEKQQLMVLLKKLGKGAEAKAASMRKR